MLNIERKNKETNPKILYPSTLSLKSEGERQTPSDQIQTTEGMCC